MKEINYQIFDGKSRLPIRFLEDKDIRNIASRENKTNSEVFTRLKKEVKEIGITYFIPITENKIEVIPNMVLLDEYGYSYIEYEDAVNKLLELDYEDGDE